MTVTMKILLFTLAILVSDGIYNYTIRTSNGDTVSLAAFKGKKILFVNTASASPYADQYRSLEALYQQYKDKLVVIAIPSNTFKSEPLDNSAIARNLRKKYGASFIITQKAELNSEQSFPLIAWLKQKSKNSVIDVSIKSDFYKFLINEEGMLVGVFAPSVDPLSPEVKEALNN